MKKFYKTVLVFEVVGDEQFTQAEIETLEEAIVDLPNPEGPLTHVSRGRIQSEKVISSRMAATQILAMEGDPAEFGLDDDGNALPDEDVGEDDEGIGYEDLEDWDEEEEDEEESEETAVQSPVVDSAATQSNAGAFGDPDADLSDDDWVDPLND